MAKKTFDLGILSILLVFGMVIVGCDNGTGNGYDNTIRLPARAQIIATVVSTVNANSEFGNIATGNAGVPIYTVNTANVTDSMRALADDNIVAAIHINNLAYLPAGNANEAALRAAVETAVRGLFTAAGFSAVTVTATNEMPVTPSLAHLFPDSNLRQIVAGMLGVVNASLTGTALINATGSLTGVLNGFPGWSAPEEEKIADAAGIEFLTGITALWLDNNQLTSIDVSNNTALITLWLTQNQLTSIDVSNNTALTQLGLSSNQLTSIDVSGNLSLLELGLANNQITSIDVSNNTALISLGVSMNQLTSIDVSNNPALTTLSVGLNQLTSIDVGNNPALTGLTVDGNQLTNIDLSNNMALTLLLRVQGQGRPNTVTIPQAVNNLRTTQAGNGQTNDPNHSPQAWQWSWDAHNTFVPVP